ncbi:hypothetical protein [Maribacter sp. Asnod2-G09]|uniref:hypothetical protein n=1 Tax=Maribacter sp. Asnod2-G09 TaxID=3160577 RepID=UPI00386FCD41
MKKIFISVLLITFGYLANAQNTINLENVNTNFSAKKVVEEYEDERNKILEEINILSSKIENEKKDKKKNKENRKELSRLILKKYEVNSIESYTWSIPIDEDKELSDENSKNWLIEYDMVSFSTADSTANFKEIFFPSINFFEEPNGGFVALNTRTNNDIPTKEYFTILNTTLDKKFGKPISKNIELFDIDYLYNEYSNDQLVYLLICPNKMEGSIRLFIINKTYLDDLKGEFSEGNWLFLK